MTKTLTVLFVVLASWLALKLGSVLPLLGSSILAIIIGVIVRQTPLYKRLDQKVIKFVSKYFLKAGIVLLGFTMSMRVIGEVGLSVIVVLAAVIIASILTAFLFNKTLKLDNKMALLIGIGTSICGGSAIATVAPIIEAEDDEVAVSVTTVFIYSMVALIVLPVIGRALSYSDQLYGVLAGAAVNDTASVVAAAFDWSSEAGSVATVVKLVRTLFLVLVSIGVIYYRLRQEKLSNNNSGQSAKINWRDVLSVVPVFVVLFVVAVVIASVFNLPAGLTSVLNRISKFLMTGALLVIGLGVDIQEIKEAGFKPVLLGGLCWLAVLLVTILMIRVFY